MTISIAPALTRLADQLHPFGLTLLGHCPTTPKDHLSPGTLVLVGPDEPRFWPLFTGSAEYSDGAPDPLDRWSARVLSAVAQNTNTTAIYPFGGPPFQPFYTWALRTGRFWASPIGFLVHETAGLFVSFRGAFLVPETIAPNPGTSPCTTCPARPCINACPVEAFAAGYDVAACKSHLASPDGYDCMGLGCRARNACPVGQGNRLPAQAAFHMKAFQ